MAHDPVRAWHFPRAQAVAYLKDIGRLWTWWVVGLAAMLVLEGGMLAVAGVGTLIGVIALLRPLQRLAAALSANRRPDARSGRLATAFGRGSEADLILRALAYGAAPFRAALVAVDAHPRWVWVRHGVVGGTVAGLTVLLVESFG